MEEIDSGQQIVAQLREAAARSTGVSGDKFRIELRERTHTSRSGAAEAVGAWAHQRGLQYGTAIPVPERIGSIGGHTITAHTERQHYITTGGKTMLRLSLEDAPGIGVTVDPAEVLRNNIGTMVQLGNCVDGIPTVRPFTDDHRFGEGRWNGGPHVLNLRRIFAARDARCTSKHVNQFGILQLTARVGNGAMVSATSDSSGVEARAGVARPPTRTATASPLMVTRKFI